MGNLEVTKVRFRFRRKEQSPNVIANVSITLNNAITIDHIRFTYNKEFDRYVLRFPSLKFEGELYSFINLELSTRLMMIKAVEEQYKSLVEKGLWRTA